MIRKSGIGKRVMRAGQDKTRHLAGSATTQPGLEAQLQLTLRPQSETVPPVTGLGGRQNADQNSGTIDSFGGHFFTAGGGSRSPDRPAAHAHRASLTADSRRAPRADPGPASAQAPSHLSTLPGRA